MPSLEDLRVFAAACHAGSLTGVAGDLGCTQSAVSQHVRRLERECGVTLLERSPRGVRPTDAGRVLADAADEGLATIAAAWRRLTEIRAGADGVLRLATGGTTLRRFMSPALADLRARHPSARIEIRCDSSTSRCLDAVREDRADLAFVTLAGRAPGLELRKVLEAPWVLVRPPGSADPTSPDELPVEVAELRADGYVAVDSSSTGRQMLSTALERRGARLAPVATVGDWDSAVLLVELGLGWTIVPATHVRGDAHPGELSISPVSDLEPIAFGWAARRFASLSPLAAAFAADLVPLSPG